MALTIVNNVLYGHDADIIEMVRQRIPVAAGGFTPSAVGLGVVVKNRLLGGVVFDQYTETDGHSNIFMSGAFDHPRWCSRRAIRQILSYPFIQLGCRRITMVTSADNAAARSLSSRLGFTEEGVLRCYFPGDADGIVYGMLREECHWLEGIDDGR